VLRRVAASLTSSVRISDYISRYGGEEFCILLPETAEEGAAVWADQLRDKLASTTMAVESRQIGVTASFGVAGRTYSTKSPKHLIDLADRALLQAKRFGRNRVVCYQDTDESPTARSDVHDLNLSFTTRWAGDVMSDIAFKLHEAEDIVQATERFLQHRVDVAPVVNDEGRLIGVLSENDIMAAMFWPDRRSITVKEAMKSDIEAFDEQTPIMDIYESLCRSWIRNAIVVKEQRPTGVISQETLLRCFSNSDDPEPVNVLK
jgi:CBS domain-containing protein